MRKLFSILGLVLTCVLAQAAAVNWTNHVPNIQVATNANVANQLQLGTTFTDGHLWPNAPDGTTPWYLEHTVPHTGGNLFELVDPLGPYFAITWLWEIQGADLLLTGDARVQGTLLANASVVTNTIIASNLTASVNGVLNVKSAPYNAKGDGIVDDTAALQLAINTATASTPVLGVYIPAGVYKITSTITITNSTDITGAGTGNHEVTPGHITVIQKAANFTAFKLSKRHIALRKLTVQGYAGSGDTTSGIQVGDLTTDAGDAILDDVTVRLCGADGIWVQNGNCCHLRVQTWGNLGNGLRLESTVVASDNVNANVVDLVSTSNSGDGLRMVKSAVNMVKVVSQGNGGYGIYNGYPNSMIEAYTEGNTSGSYYGTASAFSGTLSGKFNEGDPVMVNRYNIVQNSNATNSWFRFLYNIATPTNLVIETDALIQGAAKANNVVATNGVYTGGQTNIGVTVHTPTAVQTLAAGTVIVWDSSTERVVSSGGAVTLTGTPTIQTNGVPDGALITIRGTSDANTVTLQDYRLLAGTCIAMEMSTVTLANGGAIRFQWSAANQRWQQIDFSANSTQNHKFANLTVQTNATVGGTGGGSLTVTNGATSTAPLVVNQAVSGTANMFEANGGGTNFVRISNAGSLMIKDGTLASPGLSFGNSTNTGLYTSFGSLDIANAGNLSLVVGSSSIASYQGTFYIGSGSDCALIREGAGVLQFGPDAAAPISYSLKTADGLGSDKPGGNMDISGGKSTGIGTPGGVSITTGLIGEASASTANAYQSRAWYSPKHVTLTDSSAVTIHTFPVPANKVIGGTLSVTVYATNSVPHAQVKTSTVTFDAVAIGATIYPTISQVDNTTACDTGTLTCAYSVVDLGGNVFAIQATPVSSLLTPIIRCKKVFTAINANFAIATSDP